jgi:hypothetical protein
MWLSTLLGHSVAPDQPCKKPAKAFKKDAETYLYFDGYGGEGAGFCVVRLQGSKSGLPQVYRKVVWGHESALDDYEFRSGRATDFYEGAKFISALPVQ